jgi:hypothetical protein
MFPSELMQHVSGQLEEDHHDAIIWYFVNCLCQVHLKAAAGYHRFGGAIGTGWLSSVR